MRDKFVTWLCKLSLLRKKKMTKVPTALWKNLLAIQIYGANTGVGKTVFSTLLGAHFARRRDGEKKKRKWRVGYIKPVSTGPLSDADDR